MDENLPSKLIPNEEAMTLINFFSLEKFHLKLAEEWRRNPRLTNVLHVTGGNHDSTEIQKGGYSLAVCGFWPFLAAVCGFGWRFAVFGDN